MTKKKDLKEIVIEGEGVLRPSRIDGGIWFDYHGLSDEVAAAALKLGYLADDKVKYRVIIKRKG